MTTKALPTVAAGSGGLARYLEEVRRFPMLEPDEEYMLAKSWQEHGDTEAAHKLVTSHLRLVARIAMGYRGYGLPIGEVISEGNVGLMQAVKRFEPDKGFRLATYAMWWIRASIQEYILRSWSLVKMGTTAAQKKLFFNLRKLKGQLQAIEDGDLPKETVEKIATTLDVPEQDVVTMNRAHYTHYTSAPDPAISHVLRGWGEDGKPARHRLRVGDVYIRNVTTDIRSSEEIGRLEDGNSIFIFEVAGLCIGHLGHLHHELTASQRAKIGRLDIVFVPVDGGYTMAQSAMIQVLQDLRASIVIPMHAFGPHTLERFVAGMKGSFRIEYAIDPTVTVSLRTLPDTPEVLVMPGF